MDRDSIRLEAFDGSKGSYDELVPMFVELMETSISYTIINYASTVNELFKMLSINGSHCNFMMCNDDIAGYVITFPDNEGGLIAQQLFIKDKYRKTKVFHTIINELEKGVDESQYSYCDAIVTSDEALGLYEKRGYKKQYSVYRYQKSEE